MAFATINKPNTYFNTVTYTGTGSNQTISVGFTPDFWWIKSRSAATNNRLYNQVASGGYLVSNSTAAQVASGTVAQTTGGFIVGTDGDVNTNGATYVGWNWLGSNTTTNNTSGTISSTVCVNTTSGFSIVSWTGNGSNATIGHGLGVAPKMVLVKNRVDGAADWRVYHASVGNTVFLKLNTDAATATASTAWNNTSPTSTVFSVGTSTDVNGNTNGMIAYCFAEIKGYSRFGSYVGNGSTDGAFIYTGFKPAFLLIKQSSGAGEYWQIIDNKRDTYNVTFNRLFPNVSDANNTGLNPNIDFLSNGFKCRTASSGTNGSGATFIYMAFAENPLVGTNNVPTTAR
jgi:hypothetical protein